jgi:hypothetical protein
MDCQHLRIAHPGVMSDPEWIALESIDENTRRFIFDDRMLFSLRERGLVEAQGSQWRITPYGQKTLNERQG